MERRLTDLAPCCEAELEQAIGQALDEISEGTADPQIKDEVTYAVIRTLAEHKCETAAKRPRRRA